ncbi:Alpha/Beta hydrolase protein [Truncatella angustata]|uniref:Alpha/Beta hydrolase protein n=1 Tax=Truncatella angustata TaxID=152316 RepID=A0A9P8UNJ2_9PEZI|nr:Alpha/Beta hydrolase protein [Truncatella angustata]KAH6655964.1 Alpha/Beta hydrolase protein [Truncatella angustata]
MAVPTDTAAVPTATIAYKTDPIPIEFDLYSPTEKHDKPGALIIYYHAGATYLGSRKLGFPTWLRDGCNERGWTICSVDYRLLPESSIADIMHDLKDMWTYVHNHLNDELRRRSLTPIDLNSIFVSGGSAGGYLTFQAGHLLTPRPAGLVALYGDCFVGDWYATAHPADAIIGHKRLSDIEKHSAEIEQYFQGGRKPVTGRPFKDGTEVHSMFYHYLLRKGEFLKRTFGVGSMEEAASRPDLHYLFPQFSVKDSYPPIVLAHGKGDTAVPCEQTIFFSEFLNSKGLYNETYLLEGRDHFWDGLEEDDVLLVKAKIWSFLDKLATR